MPPCGIVWVSYCGLGRRSGCGVPPQCAARVFMMWLWWPKTVATGRYNEPVASNDAVVLGSGVSDTTRQTAIARCPRALLKDQFHLF
jgi:hypothetical protein